MALADKVDKKDSAEKRKIALKYQRDKDREKVKGIFRFYELPGGKLEFSFRKYKEDPIENYSFIDGQVYEVPLGVAKHLNTSGRYPIHAFTQTEDGKPSMKIGQKIARYGFESLEFADIEELDPAKEIVTVELAEPTQNKSLKE